MGDRVERLLEVHKAHIEWLLVLACLVRQYSEIRDLISCPPALSESCLFICNFRFGLYSDPLQYDPKKEQLVYLVESLVNEWERLPPTNCNQTRCKAKPDGSPPSYPLAAC